MFRRIKEYFAKLEEPTLSDPVFGGLHDEGHFWWGRVHFPPTGATIEVIIPNRGGEPGRRQRDFFVEVKEKYPSLEVDLTSMAAGVVAAELPRELRKTFEGLRPNEHTGEFALETITLPVGDGEDEWAATYYCRRTNHYYAVHLRGWQTVRAENIGG